MIAVFAALLSMRSMFAHNQYFKMHDDLQMMRQLQLEKCFLDGQIPCRWVPDMGYEFGFPLFNYYPQLPYLFGEIFRLFQLPFNDVAKLTFTLGTVGAGLTMYLLSKEFFGKFGGILSAVFYIWAPYRALDVYVRGAMNESWAWVWFPLILFSLYKLIEKDRHAKKGSKAWMTLYLSLSVSALLLTHNLMVIVFVPVALVWTIFWVIKFKNFPVIKNLFFAGLIALGLAAFFTLPSILEQKYVHISTLTSDYYQYFAHYATFNQLFISRYWGDGPSIFGPNDEIAFPIGHAHWGISIVLLLLLGYKIAKKRRFENSDWVTAFGIIMGTAAAFMAHEKSTFIWKAIPKLEFVQFPWRFLALNVLGYGLSAGALVNFLPKKFSTLAVSILGLLVITLNWNFFKPTFQGPLTDGQKFSGEAWRIQSQAGILDYLPIEAKDDPPKKRETVADVIEGKGKIVKIDKGTNWLRFSTEGEVEKVRINIFNFPRWRAMVDGEEAKVYVDPEEIYGLMYIDLPEGNHNVYLKLYDTPIRKISNLISVLTLAGILSFVIWKKRIEPYS
jgi:hypothetical protein